MPTRFDLTLACTGSVVSTDSIIVFVFVRVLVLFVFYLYIICNGYNISINLLIHIVETLLFTERPFVIVQYALLLAQFSSASSNYFS